MNRSCRIVLPLLSLLLSYGTGPLAAQEFRTYVGETNAVWESPTNWNPNLVPDSITEGAVIQRSVNVNVGSNLVIFTLELRGTSRVTINQSNEMQVSNFLMQGTMAGTGTLRIREGGSIGTGNTNLFDSLTVINEGTLDNFGMVFRNDPVFNNVNTINLFDNAIINDTGLLSGKTEPSLINTGFIRKDSGTGQATVSAPIDNQLEFSSTSGTLRINGGGTSSGTFRTGPDGTIELITREITFRDGSTISGEGETRIRGRVNVLANETTTFNNVNLTTGGILQGDGEIELIGQELVFERGSLIEDITVRVPDGATVSVKGGTSTTFDDTAELVVEPGGVVAFDEATSSFWNTGTATLTNNGLYDFRENGDIINNGPIDPFSFFTIVNGPTGSIIKSGGLTADGETFIVGNVVHDGVIDVQQGRMEFIGDLTANAPLTVQSGAFLRFGAPSLSTLLMRPGSSVGGGGVFEHESGLIEVEAGVRAVFDGYRTVGSSSGFVSGTGTFVLGTSESVSSIRHSGAGITEIPAGVKTTTTGNFDLDDGRILRILGELEIAQNPVSQASNDVTFDLQGILRVTADAFVNYGSGTFAMQNNGTWILSPPTRAGFGFNQYSGTGLLRVESGDIRFATRDLSLTGTIEVQSGANLEGSGLTFSPGSLLRGDGTVEGFPVRFNGTTTPGMSIGTLTVDGRAELLAQSVLEIELGDGTSDRIDISSTATIGGTLNLSLSDGFTPTEGDSWTILTASSLSGGFEAVQQPSVQTGLYFFVEYVGSDVIVTYAPPNTFSRALEQETGQLFPAGTDFDALIDLDPDADGLPHLFEWAFGGNFLSPDPDRLFELAGYDATFPGTFTFRHPVNPLANDVDFTVEGSVSPGGFFTERIVSNERTEVIDGITYRLFDVALTPQDDARFFRMTAELE